MEVRAAMAQAAAVLAASAGDTASLAAAAFVVAVVAFDPAGAEVGADVARDRSGASSGSTEPAPYPSFEAAALVAAGTGAPASVAATVWAAKARAIKETQRMLKSCRCAGTGEVVQL
eukprot:TRINITY_DN6058_c0_g1_i3.p1 TRINITY_DN6058_c0_g1~~TRINITY_DN6058_c0_g1_i3.p1  ORF type:complete len:117 (-),score=29.15 TRINITY_DN6058_c0_g1_i3:33-383(-)